MAAYGGVEDLNSWMFHQPGATIDTPEYRKAAERLQSWVERGFLAADVNAMDYSQMMGRFLGGESLFIFNGNWESGTFDNQAAGEVGFFLFPGLEPDAPLGAMAAPLTYGISARAQNPECAAFFFDWAATNDVARTIVVEVGGSRPMGPPDGFLPQLDPAQVTAQTLAGGSVIDGYDGGMGFMSDTTTTIFARSWTPNLQRLVAGEITGAELLANVQRDYESELWD